MASEILRQTVSMKLKNVLAIGETVAVEFKRAGGRVGDDVYESVCAFLNRFGGDIYLGVLDNGKVEGVPENAAIDMIKNIINVANNPTLFQPTTYLDPEIIRHNGKTLIRIHVPQSSEVHSFKRVVYDRVNDADVKVSATSQIAQMFIRKQGIFTELRIYPYLKKEDLHLELLDRVRLLAVNNAGGDHPWKNMDDETLLKSAGLYTMDYDSDKPGFNLAAALLLGRDEVIHSICPAYRTDALLRRENVDRYDDRDVENANRAPAQKIITPENLEPKPKNPTIASFFRNIGYADQLGSGVRKMFLYSKPYGGADPTFSEDDVFRITVSLNDYVGEPQNEEVNNRVNNRVNSKFSEIQQKIINVLREKPAITQREMSKCISISLVHINKNMRALQKMGAVSRVGNNKQGSWIVNEEKEKS